MPSNLEIHAELPEYRIDIVASPSDVHQILMNLGSNAAQAMTGGGSLKITLERTKRSVVLTVADTGSGMAPDVVERAFDPFFTTRPFGEGAGLGLSVVQGIVTALGGGVSIRSEPERGTVATVSVPTVPSSGELPAFMVAPPPPGLARNRVLLVDDERLLRDSLETLLVRIGCQVFCLRRRRGRARLSRPRFRGRRRGDRPDDAEDQRPGASRRRPRRWTASFRSRPETFFQSAWYG